MDIYKEALRLIRKWVRDGDPTARKILHISKLVAQAYDSASAQMHDLCAGTTEDTLRFVHNLVTSILLHWIKHTSTPLRGRVTLSSATNVFFTACSSVSIMQNGDGSALWSTRNDYTDYFLFTIDVVQKMPSLQTSKSEPVFALDHVVSQPLPNTSGNGQI